MAHLVDVAPAELVRIAVVVDGVDVAVVQLGRVAQEERLGIARADVLQEEGVLGVVLDVAPVGAALAIPVAVVQQAVVVRALARRRRKP